MSTTPEPTPEEIEAARALVAQADAQEAMARREAARAAIQPLADLGLGGSTPPPVSLRETAGALRTSAAALTGPSAMELQQLAFATAQVLETLDDRVRSVLAMNQEPAPAPEPPA